MVKKLMVDLKAIIMKEQNLNLLKDTTTNKYIPLALDPFYFLRIAETIVSEGLPQHDLMRYPSIKTGFGGEIMPQVLVFMYRSVKIFKQDITIGLIDVISPVFFFAISLIVYFFLVLKLSKSKSTALLSCLFLSIIPTYLHRTMAGFADHESLGMLVFFIVLLAYTISLKILDKQKYKKNYFIKTIFMGLIVGFFHF